MSIYNGDSVAMSEARSSRENGIFMELFKNHIFPARESAPTPVRPPAPGARTIDGAFIMSKIVDTAYANSVRDYMLSGMMSATNGEIYDAIQADDEIRDYNMLVQKEMDQIRRDVVGRIGQDLPQCRNNINVIEVPNLFHGAPVVRHRDGTMELPVPGFGDAMLPNPTNGIITNHTMVYPQQFNRAFTGYLTGATAATGLAVDYVDTWDYAHRGNGNLHCSTHALRYCRPR
jgi:hypothetical protein